MGAALLVVGLVLVGYPLLVTAYFLAFDRGLRSAGPSTFACSLQRSLSRRIPAYVDERISSGVAKTLNGSQITATESPVYGAFFYLQATANLQSAWERDHSLARVAPAVSGAEAIEASVRLMLDEGHAHWVKEYWGEDYLSEPNCFYRTLLIGSLTAHHQLTGDGRHLPLLRTVVDDLVADLDASPSGLVEDYPDQCFPCDVGVAIAMILKADEALGTDRKAWAQAAFQRILAHYKPALPPYTADVRNGAPIQQTRGCTNGFFFSHVQTIDPPVSDALYQRYVDDFWQEKWGMAGWREFPKDSWKPDLYFDADSGPVIGGFGTGSTGLGLGAARAQGDAERAGKLGAEMLVTSMPMIHGRLLFPWLVSDHEHAPYFAEICLLHQLSLLPAEAAGEGRRAAIPPLMWATLAIVTLLYYGTIRLGWRLVVGRRRRSDEGQSERREIRRT